MIYYKINYPSCGCEAQVIGGWGHTIEPCIVVSSALPSALQGISLSLRAHRSVGLTPLVTLLSEQLAASQRGKFSVLLSWEKHWLATAAWLMFVHGFVPYKVQPFLLRLLSLPFCSCWLLEALRFSKSCESERTLLFVVVVVVLSKIPTPTPRPGLEPAM